MITVKNNNFVLIDDYLTEDEIVKVVTQYLISDELKRLNKYRKYYEGMNPDITGKYMDRKYRGKKPNNLIPTAYYSTVVDTMAGYMFSNVQYVAADEEDSDYAEILAEVLKDNNSEIKEMVSGIYALAYNKGIELVYTVGDGLTSPNIRFANIDPCEMILIYDDQIEQQVICGIRIVQGETQNEYLIDVIYKNLWQYYYMKSGALSVREQERALYFSECPVIVYNSEIISNQSPFHVIIPYIDALDGLMSGNQNEIERLVDALLIISKQLKDEDLMRMDEMKALQNMKAEDRAEYLTKNVSPEFREYVSKLLQQHIHAHSHVIDWYSPDSGLTGDVSAKAMRTRLFDMDMYSKRIEMVYREGVEKRIRLIGEFLSTVGIPEGEIEIIFNRTQPNDFEDKAPVLNSLTFISDGTKLEMLGLDAERELEKLKEQKEANVEMFDLSRPGIEEQEEDQADEEQPA